MAEYGSFGDVKTGQMPKHTERVVKRVTYLAIGDLLKGLEDLFRSILIFSNINHKTNELLKRHVTLARTSSDELPMHLFLIID